MMWGLRMMVVIHDGRNEPPWGRSCDRLNPEVIDESSNWASDPLTLWREKLEERDADWKVWTPHRWRSTNDVEPLSPRTAWKRMCHLMSWNLMRTTWINWHHDHMLWWLRMVERMLLHRELIWSVLPLTWSLRWLLKWSASMRQVMLLRLRALTLMLSPRRLQWQRVEHLTSEQMVDLTDEENWTRKWQIRKRMHRTRHMTWLLISEDKGVIVVDWSLHDFPDSFLDLAFFNDIGTLTHDLHWLVDSWFWGGRGGGWWCWSWATESEFPWIDSKIRAHDSWFSWTSESWRLTWRRRWTFDSLWFPFPRQLVLDDQSWRRTRRVNGVVVIDDVEDGWGWDEYWIDWIGCVDNKRIDFDFWELTIDAAGNDDDFWFAPSAGEAVMMESTCSTMTSKHWFENLKSLIYIFDCCCMMNDLSNFWRAIQFSGGSW